MIRLFFTSLTCQFWASPYHSMAPNGDWANLRAERYSLKVLDPGFPRDDPPEQPPMPQPARPVPTDVPVPEPHDVPVPEPIDVPPPDPGGVPPVAKPSKQPGQDHKPRPVP